MTLVIRKAEVADCAALAKTLRKEDLLELLLTMPGTPEEILVGSIAASHECYVGEVDGVVIAMGGVVLMDSPRIGIPWLVGAPAMTAWPVALVRHGRRCCTRWGKLRPSLTNLTHADNTIHHTWLRHIGFSFRPGVIPVGPTQAPFIHFYKDSICAATV